MFNVGPAELLLILVLALLILGPTKLPEAARQLGKAMAEFRRVTTGLQDEMRTVLEDHFEERPHAVEPTAGYPPAVPTPTAPESANGDSASRVAPPPFTPPV
jgi:Tat protein translocase TatB subunit